MAASSIAPTRRLVQTVALGWLAFAAAGVGLRQFAGGPAITVIIDRSFCPAPQWQQQVVDPYTDLVAQADQRRLQIEQVVYVTDLNADVATEVPTPAAVADLTTFGRFNPQQIEQVEQRYDNSQVLSCNG